MKHLTLFISILLFTAVAYSQRSSYGFDDQLEPGSKLLSEHLNYTIEKIGKKRFVHKWYYTENHMLTKLVTSDNKRFTIRDGLFITKYDDGTLVTHGHYKQGVKHGKWHEHETQEGNYVEGERHGMWQVFSTDSILRREMTYVHGKLHGAYVKYDSVGQLVSRVMYEDGDLVSPTTDDTDKDLQEKPQYPGCDTIALQGEALDMCAQKKMLTYLYSNVKYPKKAKRQRVQGLALIRFIVEKDGSISEIKALNGVSKEIKEESLRVVREMPKWRPGKINGKPVRVQYRLPIKYKLN